MFNWTGLLTCFIFGVNGALVFLICLKQSQFACTVHARNKYATLTLYEIMLKRSRSAKNDIPWTRASRIIVSINTGLPRGEEKIYSVTSRVRESGVSLTIWNSIKISSKKCGRIDYSGLNTGLHLKLRVFQYNPLAQTDLHRGRKTAILRRLGFWHDNGLKSHPQHMLRDTLMV